MAHLRPTMPRLRMFLRHALPLALGVGCCLLVARQIGGVDLSALWASVRTVAAWQWALALVATAISFRAVGRYDIIAHRHFQTGIGAKQATIAGATSIALGQTLGAGVIVGAFVRWRLQPDISLIMASKISGFVAVTFLGALSVVIAVAALILPTPHIPGWLPALILLGAALLVCAAFFFPVLRPVGREIALPTLPALARLLALCLIDTFAAGLALYILTPPGLELWFAVLLPAFLISLGAAILSGTPGGVGPFELTLLSLLPQVPEVELLASVMAFRLVYYALPAALAGLRLLRPMRRPPVTESRLAQEIDLDGVLGSGTARAELGVIRQNGGSVLSCAGGSCGVVRTGQTLTALFDPLGGHTGDLTTMLRKTAKSQNRIVCTYKISARQALHAQRAGWRILHIADEAFVTPATHDLAGPAYRQLRRKLRQAEKAGITVTTPETTALPWQDMHRVSEAWEQAHGVARGLSMGHFEESYLSHQKVLLAWQGTHLIGFISLHRTTREWTLDLMRVLPDAPDGTMHLLVQRAIESARDANVPSLSLASVPALPNGRGGIENRLRLSFDKRAGGPGLRQFKACFAPRWKPLFMAAPGWSQLVLAACDLIRAVRLGAQHPQDKSPAAA